MSAFVCGLDLGQASDPSALVIVEKRTDRGRDVRHAARFPLGTSYPTIVQDVHALLNQPPLRANVTLVIDATGVGRPVCDLFTLQRGRQYGIVQVVITAGNAVTFEAGFWHVPKRDLVAAVQVPLQNKQLRFPEAAKLPAVNALTHELGNFRATISAAGHDTYAAWRERDHDDLVLSLALALWQAQRGQPNARPIGADERPGWRPLT